MTPQVSLWICLLVQGSGVTLTEAMEAAMRLGLRLLHMPCHADASVGRRVQFYPYLVMASPKSFLYRHKFVEHIP